MWSLVSTPLRSVPDEQRTFTPRWSPVAGEKFILVPKPDAKAIYLVNTKELAAPVALAKGLGFEPVVVAYVEACGGSACLFAADAEGKLWQIPLEGDLPNAWPKSPNEVRLPEEARVWDLLVADGSLYGLAGGERKNCVFKYKPGGTPMVKEVDENVDWAPTGLASDSGGPIYMARGRGGTVEVWTTSLVRTEVLDTLPPSTLTPFRPTRIRVNPIDSSLWMTSYNVLIACHPDSGNWKWGSPIEVTSEDDCVNDFAFVGDWGICATCTYTDRLAFIDISARRRIQYYPLHSPGWIESTEGRILVLSFNDERLYMLSEVP